MANDALPYWQQPREQVAVEAHSGAVDGDPHIAQIDLKPGDVLIVDWIESQLQHHWAGWTTGRNCRTNQHGNYPSHKVVEKWRVVPFPMFNLSAH